MKPDTLNTLGLMLMGVGGVFVILNWSCLIASLVTKKFHSMVPPLGGLLVMTGLIFVADWRHLAWIGLLVDPGFLAFVYCFPDLYRQLRRSSNSRLKLSLCGHSDELEVKVRLFKPDYYEIKLVRKHFAGPPGWQERGSLGAWKCIGDRIELISHTNKPEHPSRAVLKTIPNSNGYEVTESTFVVSDDHDASEFPPVSFRFEIKLSK